MSKRTPGLKRRKHDKYYTPFEAVGPLIPHLISAAGFVEPCAGDGRLVEHLQLYGLKNTYSCDIEPDDPDCWIDKRDAMTLTSADMGLADYIITNPAWSRDILHPMIDHFRQLRPTWLLFDADWMHTKQAAPYLEYCSDIVSVGRVSWMENGKGGMDNCAWYCFRKNLYLPTFHGRMVIAAPA
jgi:hypothetical protein